MESFQNVDHVPLMSAYDKAHISDEESSNVHHDEKHSGGIFSSLAGYFSGVGTHHKTTEEEEERFVSTFKLIVNTHISHMHVLYQPCREGSSS